MQSRYRAAALANREMLSLYFGIGKFISENSRGNFWGTNAIEVISQQLQQELPGLREFSASNMKRMRTFYESWCDVLNCHLPSDELECVDNKDVTNRPLVVVEFENTNRPLSMGDLENIYNQRFTFRQLTAGEISTDLLLVNRQSLGGDLKDIEWKHFLSIGFTHHCEIIEKTNSLKERLFYIQRCATEFWSKKKL